MHAAIRNRADYSALTDRERAALFHEDELTDSYSSPFADHEERLAARLAVKVAAHAHSEGSSLKDFVVLHAASGAPMIRGRDSLHCSLSHSKGYAVGVVATYRVGVDLEQVRVHDERIMDVIASKSEWGILPSEFSRHERITLLWTIKEAILKAVESGLSISPRQVELISCTQDTNEKAVTYSSIVRLSGWSKNWRVESRNFSDLFLSIAYEENNHETITYHWH